MSRHKVNLREPREDVDHAVIGYDRPLNEYFVQYFDAAGEVVAIEDGVDPHDMGDVLEIHESLLDVLNKEAAGVIDPNYCLDWRQDRA